MNEENKIASLGYEQLNNDIELEIFGLKFGIGLSENYLKKIKDLKYEDEDSIKEMIDSLLGNGSYDKISEKYKKDQGKEIDEFVWLKVALFIKQQFDEFTNNYQSEFDKIQVSRPVNRSQRRNNRYNRNYNNGRYNNRGYRRY